MAWRPGLGFGSLGFGNSRFEGLEGRTCIASIIQRLAGCSPELRGNF